MKTVFISYAREDKDFVNALVCMLAESGENVWWDKKVVAGQKWRKELRTQIAISKCVIVIWSKHSINSEWVDCEAYEAAELNKIIPIRVDSARIPFDFRSLQTIEFSHWNKTIKDDCFSDLLGNIRHYSDSSSLVAKRQSDILYSEDEIRSRTHFYLGGISFFIHKSFASAQLVPVPAGLRILYIPVINNQPMIEDEGYLNILVPVDGIGGIWKTTKAFLYAAHSLDENIILQDDNLDEVLIKLARDAPEAEDGTLSGKESCWLALIDGREEKRQRKLKLGASDLISLELACQTVASMATTSGTQQPRALRPENKRPKPEAKTPNGDSGVFPILPGVEPEEDKTRASDASSERKDE